MTARFRLLELLEQRGLTQAKIAGMAKVGLRTVSRLCRNETEQVSLIVLEKIAFALGVEPGDLIVREKKGRR